MENTEKIEIKPNQFVWVDKDAEIKEGDRVIAIKGIWKNHITFTTGTPIADVWLKIIAASPELNLEGVPSYVEWLAEKEYKKNPFWIGSGDTARLYDENKGKRNSFIKGYKTAEKELFTEEDIRKAIELAQEREYDDWGFKGMKYDIEEIIEQLKQSKTQTK